ncbi:hypothetical protein CGZ98_03440 [Enemella evansiae]|uniref:acyltransferase domain-containing protein n=1 Tax=Enemella evansiae TaxID=2016499 RepID=UPI000B96CB3B|nr:acyltransferase domain-containing protein [Enemella evansiae]OYO15473.1 hypothetical protein CGZ98_03440 [Enemella evansiae]
MSRAFALMVPGQGSQRPGMATNLYRQCRSFARDVDCVLELFGAPGLRSDWLSVNGTIDRPELAQPLLFAVNWSLCRQVLSSGARPVAVLGHSAGELVVSVIAGLLDLESAVSILRDRVGDQAELPAGGMIAIAATCEQVTPLLPLDCAIAAVNSPRQVMVAGAPAGLAALSAALDASGVIWQQVGSTAPFHSPLMAPEAERALEALRSVTFHRPTIPIYSAYTGGRLNDRDAQDPEYWAHHVTNPVLFSQAVEALIFDHPAICLLEAGPGQTLTAFAKRNTGVLQGPADALAVLPDPLSPHLTDDWKVGLT